jgi:RNA recognition motif-containing protein
MKPLPITFRSYEEEQDWLADRRQRRLQRPTKFDIRGGANNSSTDEVMGNTSLNGQHQTRHARRLYVGNLPLGVTETEIHDQFRAAIRATIDGNSAASNYYDDNDDPILTVYINHERRFSFIEFKSVEICSACMVLDGLEILPGYPVKVRVFLSLVRIACGSCSLFVLMVGNQH